jgi:hypothetical protein
MSLPTAWSFCRISRHWRGDTKLQLRPARLILEANSPFYIQQLTHRYSTGVLRLILQKNPTKTVENLGLQIRPREFCSRTRLQCFQRIALCSFSYHSIFEPAVETFTFRACSVPCGFERPVPVLRVLFA